MEKVLAKSSWNHGTWRPDNKKPKDSPWSSDMMTCRAKWQNIRCASEKEIKNTQLKLKHRQCMKKGAPLKKPGRDVKKMANYIGSENTPYINARYILCAIGLQPEVCCTARSVAWSWLELAERLTLQWLRYLPSPSESCGDSQGQLRLFGPMCLILLNWCGEWFHWISGFTESVALPSWFFSFFFLTHGIKLTWQRRSILWS